MRENLFLKESGRLSMYCEQHSFLERQVIRAMNKEILIRLTPLETYFLGSDRTFHYGEKDVRRIGKSDYFIKSVKIPSLTILCLVSCDISECRTVRLIMCWVTLSNISAHRRSGSWTTRMSFGMIKSISPLFLMQNSTDRKLTQDPSRSLSCGPHISPEPWKYMLLSVQ